MTSSSGVKPRQVSFTSCDAFALSRLAKQKIPATGVATGIVAVGEGVLVDVGDAGRAVGVALGVEDGVAVTVGESVAVSVGSVVGVGDGLTVGASVAVGGVLVGDGVSVAATVGKGEVGKVVSPPVWPPLELQAEASS